MKKGKDWQSLIEEQAVSGESQAEFCRKKGISLSLFQYHRSKRGRSSTLPRLVPIVSSVGDAGSSIELRFGDEIRILFPIEVSAGRLAEVVRCLSSR